MESVEASSTHNRGLRELLEDYERRLIVEALEASGGHQRRPAASLGVLPSTLCEKMKRLGIRNRVVFDAQPIGLESSFS